jgi:hypothetical protein
VISRYKSNRQQETLMERHQTLRYLKGFWHKV